MLNGAKGSLFLIDRKRSQIFTVNGAAVKRLNASSGIIGYTARSGQGILCELFYDQRYDETIDDLTLHPEYYSQSKKHIIQVGVGGGGGKISALRTPEAYSSSTSSAMRTPYGIVAARSPLVLSIPVRNCEGTVIGVLAATHSVDASSGERKSFSKEDGLVLTLLGCFIASNVEKVATKRVLTQASANIVTCENTLRSAIGGTAGGGELFVETENSFDGIGGGSSSRRSK